MYCKCGSMALLVICLPLIWGDLDSTLGKDKDIFFSLYSVAGRGGESRHFNWAVKREILQIKARFSLLQLHLSVSDSRKNDV